MGAVFITINSMAVSKNSTSATAELQLETAFALSWLFKVAGGFIATVAGMALLLRSLDREPPSTLLPLILPLLGGVLLFEVHWSVAVAIAVAVIGFIAKEAAVTLRAR